MKKSFVLIALFAFSSSIVLSMNQHEIVDLISHDSKSASNPKPFSIDDYIENYDPCTLLIHGACLKILHYSQSIIKQIELLNRALSAEEPKEKKD